MTKERTASLRFETFACSSANLGKIPAPGERNRQIALDSQNQATKDKQLRLSSVYGVQSVWQQIRK